MGGASAWVRVAWRRRAGSIVVVGVVVGLALGFSLVCFAGARRTDTAFDRLADQTLAPDAFLDVAGEDNAVAEQLAEEPFVEAFGRFSFVPISPAPIPPGEGAGFVGWDEDFLRDVYRPLPIEGRLARPDHPEEIVVNEAMADAGGFEPGDETELFYGFEDPVSLGPTTIVGVVRGILDISVIADTPATFLSSAFLEAHPDVDRGEEANAMFRLRDGPDGIDELEARAADLTGQEVQAGTRSEVARGVERTLGVQKLALQALGVAAAAALLVVVTQAMARVLDAAFADLGVLVALGLAPRRRLLLGPVLVAPLAVVALVVGGVASWLASPLIPTGFARDVDPVRGVQVDTTVLVIGGLAWLLAAGLVGMALAWRARRRAVARPLRPPAFLQPLPVAARLGATAALAPARDRAGSAARSALVAAALATTGVVAVATFGHSLDELVADARLQGWDFDAAVSAPGVAPEDLQEQLAAMADDPNVAEVATLALVAMEVGDRFIEAYAVDPAGDGVHPTIRSGRPPVADDEIALGADTLDRTGTEVGDEVTVAGAEGEADLRIVGSATYPAVGDQGDIADAASLTLATARRIGALEAGSVAFVRLAPGAEVSDLDVYGEVGEIIAPFEDPRVKNLREVGRVPTLLAAFLAVLGLAALLHALIRSLQVRRHDLAVLVALGFRRHDLRRMTASQALATVVVGGGIGLLVGTVVGRLAWSATAAANGVVEKVVVPGAVVAVVGLAVVLSALLLAAFAQRVFGGRPPARVLNVD